MAPTARLILPHRALTSCVPCYISRSTIGCEQVSAYNRYPATPFCAVAWLLRGPSAMVYNGVVSTDMVAQAGEAIFNGPQTNPWVCFNSEPSEFFVALFYPDALHALCGADLSNYVDQFAPAHQVLGEDWVGLGQAMMSTTSDEERVALLDGFLAPRWEAVRADAGLERRALGDWVRRLALHAASAGIGRSARIVERRVRAWAGLPMRTLTRMGRAEQALLAARAEQAQGKVSWVGVAADSGYADQAHLSRETRAITGLSPTELAHAMQHDDSYWLYRIWS